MVMDNSDWTNTVKFVINKMQTNISSEVTRCICAVIKMKGHNGNYNEHIFYWSFTGKLCLTIVYLRRFCNEQFDKED